ncbi:hypothetical protein GmHk_18G052025 [Glycine max]|nr:hypothetical protein GmHk_18G052025 [Glycine max]
MHIGGYNICGEAHESGMCIVQDDVSKEVNYMTNPHHQGFHQRELIAYNQGEISLKAKVSLSNHKSTKSSIKNLEVQVGQLAKQLAETSTDNFGANTEKNPKEECKVIFARSQRRKNVEKEKRVEGVLEDVSNEEGKNNKREDGDEEKEESKERGEKVLPTKTKSQLAREARRETPIAPVKDIPYPLVPSKKEKERYLAHFLDIFKNLKITIPFEETL